MKKVIPCLFTSGNLGFGVLSIMLTSQGYLTWGAVCILLAMVCDALDGRTARALGVQGEFGKELDSLSDCVSFGAAPGFLIYSYSLHELGWIGMIPPVLYARCGGLRLARFNLNTPWSYRSHIALNIAFTFSHTGIERLLREWLHWEYPNPDLSLTIHVTRNSLTSRLDLLSGHPAILEGLKSEGAECKLVASLSHTLHHILLFPSVLGFLWL